MHIFIYEEVYLLKQILLLSSSSSSHDYLLSSLLSVSIHNNKYTKLVAWFFLWTEHIHDFYIKNEFVHASLKT